MWAFGAKTKRRMAGSPVARTWHHLWREPLRFALQVMGNIEWY